MDKHRTGLPKLLYNPSLEMFQTPLDRTQADRSAVEFICSEWRLKPDGTLQDPSTLNCPVTVGLVWDSELPTKVKMRLRISKSSGPVSKEDERKSFEPLVLGSK